MKYYTGIGSRKTPKEVLLRMSLIARMLRTVNFSLRSGGAEGADTAFEEGSKSPVQEQLLHIFTADDVKGDKDALHLMYLFHPAPQHLSPYARLLMARNAYQVLGKPINENHKSSFVLCWTPDGADGINIPTSSKTGGTGQAIRIAIHYKVPVINMKNPDWEARLIGEVWKVLKKESYQGWNPYDMNPLT